MLCGDKTVNDAVWIHNGKCFKEDIANNYKKLQDIKDDSFGRKDYLSSKAMQIANRINT